MTFDLVLMKRVRPGARGGGAHADTVLYVTCDVVAPVMSCLYQILAHLPGPCLGNCFCPLCRCPTVPSRQAGFADEH